MRPLRSFGFAQDRPLRPIFFSLSSLRPLRLNLRFRIFFYVPFAAKFFFQFGATHAVKTDGVSFSTGSHESPRSRVTYKPPLPVMRASKP